MSELKLLSVAETWWDSDCIASQQTTGFGINQHTIRFSIDLKSHLTIQEFNHAMRQTGSVVLKDFDIEGMLQYLQEAKQLLDEQKLINKLMGKK